MESLVINRPVRVLVKVTEGFKEQLRRQAKQELKRIDSELEQLQFQRKRWMSEMAKSDPKNMENLRESLEREQNSRERRKVELQSQIKQAEDLQVGEMVQQGTVESRVEVSPGDSWQEIMNTVIVVEDGEIIDIKNAANDD